MNPNPIPDACPELEALNRRFFAMCQAHGIVPPLGPDWQPEPRADA